MNAVLLQLIFLTNEYIFIILNTLASGVLLVIFLKTYYNAPYTPVVSHCQGNVLLSDQNLALSVYCDCKLFKN